MERIKRSLPTLAVLLFACLSSAKEMTEIEALSSKPSKCTYEHAYDMYGAYCAGLRLSKIPNLRGGIEILDFSDNKLRELQASTLSGYSSIKFLYLVENQIYFIEDTALSSLTYLVTLDLSKNVITELPNAIFQLPSLRKLYLSGNPLIHLNPNTFKVSIPIAAPLELLEISDCKIKELPNWGYLPQLIMYNISHNELTSLSAEHFAVMCNLKKVDITEAIDKVNLCDLKPTIQWFTQKKVNFDLKDYTKLNSIEFDSCPQVEISPTLNQTHYICKSRYQQVQNIKAAKSRWLTIGGGLAGFLVGFILLLYVMHRHNVAQTKGKGEKSKVVASHNDDKNASDILLNNVS